MAPAEGIPTEGHRQKHHRALNKPKRDRQQAERTLPGGEVLPTKGQQEHVKETVRKAWNRSLVEEPMKRKKKGR